MSRAVAPAVGRPRAAPAAPPPPVRPALESAKAESFMRAAVREAAKGLGRTSPNPPWAPCS